jgi:hypothetical protein
LQALKGGVMLRVMVFNATFNNITFISWRAVLLVEETGVPGAHIENIFTYFIERMNSFINHSISNHVK